MGLTQLRTNPQTVLSSEHFFVDTRNLVQTPLGCTVQINEQLKNGVFIGTLLIITQQIFIFHMCRAMPDMWGYKLLFRMERL